MVKKQSPKGRGTRTTAATAAAVSVATIAGNGVGLSAEQLNKLQQTYGLDIQLKSDSEPVTSIIHQVTESSPLGKRIIIAGVHDKTSPGYDRDYNKDA